MQTQFIQHFVAGLTHQLRTRIVVLVDPMTEAHQLHIRVLVFNLGDELANFLDTTITLNVLQHLKRRFIRATMCRTPQAGNTRGDTGKRIRTRGARQSDGRC